MSTIRRGFTDRMIAAAKLDVSLYEEVEADTDATMQAAGVVMIAAVASAIGGIDEGARGIPSAILLGIFT